MEELFNASPIALLGIVIGQLWSMLRSANELVVKLDRLHDDLDKLLREQKATREAVLQAAPPKEREVGRSTRPSGGSAWH